MVAGDTNLTRFGLSEEQFHFLSYDTGRRQKRHGVRIQLRHLDVVIHAAAKVNLIYPYHALRDSNVVGTVNHEIVTFYPSTLYRHSPSPG